MPDRRRVLVTGGAGFIGSHLVDALLEAGFVVRVLDDLSTGSESNLNRDAELICGSILDLAACDKACDGVGTVFHLAASVSVPASVSDPRESFETNALGTFNVLDSARRSGVSKVVYSSSSAVYGDSPELPKSEQMAPSPVSPYAAGKLAGEHVVTVYARSYGMETVSLRYFNVFGPRQRPDSPYAAAIPIFFDRILRGEELIVYGDGQQTRDFTYVDNVVEANLLCLEAKGLQGQVVNCACGEQISINELIAEIEKITGRSATIRNEPPRVGDVKFSVAACDLAEQLLGFRPRVAWRDGLRLTSAYYLT